MTKLSTLYVLHIEQIVKLCYRVTQVRQTNIEKNNYQNSVTVFECY